ncbi:restriction endonuclease subunit S [Sulfitobacter pacificus]|uniref:restriction endonuclease subunit S n=1 Tax=Sulfitobacter pacificus TaxID=1499314 RepID=UPI0031051DC2
MKAGWEAKPLGEVCEIYQPKTISKKEMVDDGAYPVFGANGTIGRYDKFNHEEAQLLITCRGATCGSVNVSDPFSWITGNSMVVRPKAQNLEQDYLKYFFLGAVDLSGVITGAAQPQITRASLSPVSLHIPPLEEQKRIVAVLDAAFEGLTRATEHAEANLQNARELFESGLAQAIETASISAPKSELSELCITISDGDHAAPPKSKEGVPFITISNVNKQTNEIDFSNTFKVPEDYFKLLKENRRPRQGDILYTVTGSFGIPIHIKDEKDFCFQRHIGLVRPSDRLLSRWLYYLLMSPQVFEQAEQGAKGAAQRTVSLKVLRGFIVPVVELSLQEKIVAGLDELREHSRILEAHYRTKLTDIADLRQSLLQKAFAGALT